MSDDPQTEPTEQAQPEVSAYTQLEQRHYQEIRDEEREVAKMEADHREKKDSASAAKKRFEAADKELRDFIRRGADPQLPLPYMDADPLPEYCDCREEEDLPIDTEE